jgi:amino acid permease
MYIHVIFYIINIAVLLACTKKKNTAKYVFTEFHNTTGWDSDGIAWCVGLLSALFAFFSLDTTVHFSEEIENPATAVPRASK